VNYREVSLLIFLENGEKKKDDGLTGRSGTIIDGI
jgi:hypothetical protein